MAGRLTQLARELRKRTPSTKVAWTDAPNWTLPPLDLIDGDRCWVKTTYVGREHGLTRAVWAVYGPKPSEEEHEAQLLKAFERARQQHPHASTRSEPESLGDDQNEQPAS